MHSARAGPLLGCAPGGGCTVAPSAAVQVWGDKRWFMVLRPRLTHRTSGVRSGLPASPGVLSVAGAPVRCSSVAGVRGGWRPGPQSSQFTARTAPRGLRRPGPRLSAAPGAVAPDGGGGPGRRSELRVRGGADRPGAGTGWPTGRAPRRCRGASAAARPGRAGTRR